MTKHYKPKTDDRRLLESIQSRFEESLAKPEVLVRALKRHLRKYLGPYIPRKLPVLCKVCNREIPQKPIGARQQLCNKRCRKKWATIQRNRPSYKLWRKKFDARPEQRARRLKYMKDVYLPKKQQQGDNDDISH